MSYKDLTESDVITLHQKVLIIWYYSLLAFARPYQNINSRNSLSNYLSLRQRFKRLAELLHQHWSSEKSWNSGD